MSDIITYTKTIASGTKKLAIVPAEERFQRLSNLPADWQRVRIALSLSWTDLTGDNNTPVADTRTTSLGAIGEFAIGLSNGVGDVGTAGNRFVGMAIPNTTAMFLALSTGTWRLSTSSTGTTGVNWNTRIGDGVTMTASAALGVTNPLANTDPVATTGFCVHAVLDLSVATAGTLSGTMGFVAVSQSDPRVKGSLFGTLPAAVNATGGWWSAGGSPTPVACQYLSIRCPFPQNRLRVLDSEIRQLA